MRIKKLISKLKCSNCGGTEELTLQLSPIYKIPFYKSKCLLCGTRYIQDCSEVEVEVYLICG